MNQCTTFAFEIDVFPIHWIVWHHCRRSQLRWVRRQHLLRHRRRHQRWCRHRRRCSSVDSVHGIAWSNGTNSKMLFENRDSWNNMWSDCSNYSNTLTIGNTWLWCSQVFDTQFVDWTTLSCLLCIMESNKWKIPTQPQTTFEWHASYSANSFPHWFCENKERDRERENME